MSNSFKIANAIGFIDDDLIADAEEFKTSFQKPVYIRYAAAAAACLCVAGGAAVIAGKRKAPAPAISSEPTNTENHGIQSSNTGGDPVTSNMPIVKMSGICFNETTSPEVGGSRLYFSPDKYDELSCDKQAVFEYYGKELTPAYIPEGLIPQNGNGMATMFAEKGGKLVYDNVGLSFYHDYYEDGSPKLTENIAAVKGVSVVTSKLGMPFDCGMFSAHEDMKATYIGETEVLFGYRSMSYGPYDPETHEPSGYYDVYVAEFTFDGISYQINTYQLASEEIVKIVSSVIYGEDFLVGED